MTDTKERILQTALRLFAEDGYEAVSVSTIAGELGMTKGALYKHYKNKQDIFDSIVARAWSSVTQSRPETMRCRRELWTRWKKHIRAHP